MGERPSAPHVDDDDQMIPSPSDADAVEAQVTPASVQGDIDGDGDSDCEPPTAPWQLTLDEATATEAHEVDWKVVDTAVQQWNNDGVARRW